MHLWLPNITKVAYQDKTVHHPAKLPPLGLRKSRLASAVCKPPLLELMLARDRELARRGGPLAKGAAFFEQPWHEALVPKQVPKPSAPLL